MLGGFFILLGGWFLIRQYVPGVEWDYLWPLIIIGVGVPIVALSVGRR